MPAPILSIVKPGQEGTTFENLLHDSPTCGFIMLDQAGGITARNPEAERLLDLPAGSSSLPLAVSVLVHEVFQTGKPVANRNITLESRGNSAATLSATALPVAGARGPGVVVMLNDSSATTRLESHLRRLDRLARVGTLSAGWAHEIKNALVAVKTFVDLLLEKNQDAELSRTVVREIDRMEGLVTHMLKFAAPPQPIFSGVHLHHVLDLSLQMIHPRINAKLISVQREYGAAEDLLPGDDAQLEQAFLNLLLNAVDALGEGGTLSLSTKLEDTADGQRLEVRITDNGPGISEESRARIFEPFFTTKPRGNGLGLAVTRRIIEDHQGAIRFDSRLGEGTTFTIHLPTGPAPGQH